jgi:hypothetical protein
MNPRLLYIGGFTITAGYISYLDIRKCSTMPWPPRIIATGLVFVMLDLFGGFYPELSGVMAFGLMLALIVNARLKFDCTRNCKCYSQAADTILIPGIVPNDMPPQSPTGRPRTPLDPGTIPIEPPGSTPLEPIPALPELPAIPL